LNILFLGDIIGSPGRRAIKSLLPKVVEESAIDMVVANGENAAGGFGITENIAEELHELGVDIITSGNHIFDKKEVHRYLDSSERLIRPANYPDVVPGVGAVVVKHNSLQLDVAVINISGVVFMEPIGCPFYTIDKELDKLPDSVKVIIVDFHAEVTSEKICMGWYLDGRVSALLGTHTHVPTADERILPQGTGYITDVGMTGPYDSVIGVKKDIALRKFLTRMPTRFDTAKKDIRLCGAIMQIDNENGKCLDFKRVSYSM